MNRPWLADRRALIGYRLAAARYGLWLRMSRPSSQIVGELSLLLAVVGVAVAFGIRGLLHPLSHASVWAWALAAVLALAVAWLAIRYLGSLSTMMRAAASGDEVATKLRDDMHRGMSNADTYRRLRELYEPALSNANARLRLQGSPHELELVDGSGDEGAKLHEYAAVAMPLAGEGTLETLLRSIDGDEVHGLDRYARAGDARQKLMRRWRKLDGHTRTDDEKGDNYRLLDVAVDKSAATRVTLDVGIARYGHVARTCEALVNEFALFAFLTTGRASYRPLDGMRSSTVLRCQPWRHATHKRAAAPGDLFLKPLDRAACLGVAVATLLRVEDGLVATLGTRSDEVGTYPRALHVIPAGMTNTHGTEDLVTGPRRRPAADWYLRTAMRSEFLEEWFNDTQLEVSRVPEWQATVDRKWVEREGPDLILTGIAFDLLNLRPEACGVAMVSTLGDELCWEYMKGQQVVKRPIEEIGSISPMGIVQGGAATLLLAQRWVSERRERATSH